MGVTSDIMTKSLSAVGYRTVAAIKGLHAFKKGEICAQKDILQDAHKAGAKLGKTIALAEYLRKNFV